MTDADDMATDLNYASPNYTPIFARRIAVLRKIRQDPKLLPVFKQHYRNNPADFISDWGVTYDPRLIEVGLPAMVPFVLWPKQREWVNWVIDHWKNQKSGITEKSRDWGVSWLAVALGCTLCLFNEGMSIGYGSRKEEYVDKLGNLKALFPKARMFMENLPEEFRGGYVAWRDAPHMRLHIPDTGSVMVGEAGTEIGRGDREAIYFVDEAAYLENALAVEHALSQTTNCRMDISSVRGMNNLFAQKRHSGRIDVFICDWRDDPRKSQKWYDKQVAELDPITVAQEIDRDYSASVSGVVIPGQWVRAAIDANKALGIAPSGARQLAFDVADEGTDKNAYCITHGTEIVSSHEWSGKGDDIFGSVQTVFDVCDEHGLDGFRYDGDGLGAGVRGDARIINERRKMNKQPELTVEAFRGSEGVFKPEDEDVKGRKNKDYFLNRKSQAWWSLRVRFQKTYRWVKEGVACPPDEIISISSKCANHLKLVAELSQPTYSQNATGKMVIVKKPARSMMKSPNMADAVMMRFAQNTRAPMPITNSLLVRAATGGNGRRRR